MRRLTLVLLIFFGVAEATHAQVCRRDSIPESTPTQRFRLNNDGTATDTYSGLKWKRCPVGQTLAVDVNGLPECAGLPFLDGWSNALLKAKNEPLQPGDTGEWRLPTIKELTSIVDVQCFDPPFNRAIFPATWSIPPNSTQIIGYWSSTPAPAYLNQDSSSPPFPMAWGLLLSDGATGRYSLLQPMLLLLVKSP